MAVVAGAGAGHLVAAFVEPASSPVLAIGSAVVDRVPAGVKELAVRWVGTADKPVLIGLVAIVSLVLGFLAGRMQRRGFGVWLVAALAALSAWAAVTRPAAGAYAVLPSLVAGVTGMAVLALLVARPGIATAPLQSAGRDTPYDESAHGVSLPADGRSALDGHQQAVAHGEQRREEPLVVAQGLAQLAQHRGRLVACRRVGHLVMPEHIVHREDPTGAE